jgi:hypothetical protein
MLFLSKDPTQTGATKGRLDKRTLKKASFAQHGEYLGWRPATGASLESYVDISKASEQDRQLVVVQVLEDPLSFSSTCVSSHERQYFQPTLLSETKGYPVVGYIADQAWGRWFSH